MIVAGETERPVTSVVVGVDRHGFGAGVGVGVVVGVVASAVGRRLGRKRAAERALRRDRPSARVHRQRNGPLPALAEFHVQSTSIARPAPLATTLPLGVVTVIVHGSVEESRPWKRIGPPSAPDAATE